MTLPSIETALHARNLNIADVSEELAQQIVYDAIETDLADGLAYLKKFQKYNWGALTGQEECCIHCEIKDIAVRKQVVRLGAYHPLRRYVQDKLGLMIALHNFRPTSNDGGPSARLIVEPVERKMFNGRHVVAGELKTSPAQTWQVMSWGNTPKPPALLSDAEAREHLWDYAETHLSRGLAFLRDSAATPDRIDADGELIPEVIQLIGVPGMHAVVAERMGTSFAFYNCCGSKTKTEEQDDKKVLEEVSFLTQMMGQAHSEMMDC